MSKPCAPSNIQIIGKINWFFTRKVLKSKNCHRYLLLWSILFCVLDSGHAIGHSDDLLGSIFLNKDSVHSSCMVFASSTEIQAALLELIVATMPAPNLSFIFLFLISVHGRPSVEDSRGLGNGDWAQTVGGKWRGIVGGQWLRTNSCCAIDSCYLFIYWLFIYLFLLCDGRNLFSVQTIDVMSNWPNRINGVE